MSIEDTAQDAAGEAASEVQTEQKQQSDPALETRAREMGWVPETEWKGTPPKGGFRSAEDFIQRGEEVLPIVRSELEKTRAEKADLTKRLETLERETSDKISRMEKMSKTALDRQRLQIEEKFEAIKEAAVDTGDKAAYREADKAAREALKDFDKQTEEKTDDKPEKKGPVLPRDITDTIEGWVSENSTWFNRDAELTAVANVQHEKLLKEKPGLTIKQNLDEVRKYVAAKYPEKFGVGDKEEEDDDDFGSKRGSPVEGGARMNGGGSKSQFGKLPKEAQIQADKFIKDDGLFLEKGETVEKNINQARERYAAQYLES